MSPYEFIKILSYGGTTVEDKIEGVEPEDKGIEISEAKVEDDAGHRSELVCQEDIALVTKMSKDELKKYAHSRLDKKLDLNRRLKMLRLDVVMLIKGKLQLPTDTDGTPPEESNVVVSDKAVPEFVFEPKRRRVFEWTELLGKRDDLIECWLVDKKGKRL